GGNTTGPSTWGKRGGRQAGAQTAAPPIRTKWRWPTTKWVWVSWKLKGAAPSMMPVKPPIKNMDRKPAQKSIGEANEIRPPYMVASQLKNLMPVGIEIRKVDTMKKRSAVRLMPTVNM